ncbi:hypothetical protein V2G26_013992 [Clonostachys chloroleuca]
MLLPLSRTRTQSQTPVNPGRSFLAVTSSSSFPSSAAAAFSSLPPLPPTISLFYPALPQAIASSPRGTWDLEERASVHLTARREPLGVSTCIISCLPLRRCPTLSLDDSDFDHHHFLANTLYAYGNRAKRKKKSTNRPDPIFSCNCSLLQPHVHRLTKLMSGCRSFWKLDDYHS